MSLDKKINYSMYILLKFKTFMVRFPIVIQNVGGIVKSGTPPPPQWIHPRECKGIRINENFNSKRFEEDKY